MADDLAALIVDMVTERFGPTSAVRQERPSTPNPQAVHNRKSSPSTGLSTGRNLAPCKESRRGPRWTEAEQAAHREALADWWVPDTQMPWGRRRAA